MEGHMLSFAFILPFLLDGVTPRNYARIELGMTKQEVVTILGRPPVEKVTQADRFSWWFTSASHEIRQNGELWRSGTLRIWLRFDNQRRVTGKMMEGPERQSMPLGP